MVELMNRQKDNSKEPFWGQQRKRCFYHTVVSLQLAGEVISGANIQKMILTAATSPDQLLDAAWKANYHSTVLKRAGDAGKNTRHRFDHESLFQFFTGEWPNMAEKTRSNIIADAMSVLHPLNSGVVRDLIGTTTTNSLDDMEKGIWWLIDMPLQRHGESGRFVGGAIKYLIQRYKLAREVTEASGPIIEWIDEAQNYVTSNDALTVNEQQSYK